MGFENFFHSHTKKEKQALPEKKETKRGALDLVKIAALLAMFALPGQAEAQEKAISQEKKEDKVELTQQYLKKVREYVKTKTEGGSHTLNGIEINEYSLAEGQEVIAAESGVFTIFSEDGGRKAFLDLGSDGRVDRALINKHDYTDKKMDSNYENNQRRMDNFFYLLQSLESMEKSISVEASLDPKDVSVFDLDHGDKQATVLDYNDGSIGQSQEAEEYQGLADKLQDSYFVRLEDLAKAAGEAGN